MSSVAVLPATSLQRRCAACSQLVQDGAVHACPSGGPGPVPDPEDPLLHAVLGERYEITARLGRGGMGVVYRARHVALRTDVAIKVLLRSSDPTAQQRFLREAQLASAVRHPHTVTVHDFGVLAGGHAFLVMELVNGPTLAEVIGRGPLAPVRALRITRQIAQGLAAVHAQQIVHRDLKPDNIFLVAQEGQPDSVKIVDFGIALALAPAVADEPAPATGPRLTEAGSTIGTAHYMSPEQAEGASLDGRSDQYSLGVVLYEMLAGKPPFDGSPMTVLTAHLARPPPPFAAHAPGVKIPPPAEQFVLRMLAKEPGRRWDSMRTVISEIDRVLGLIDPAQRRRRLALWGLAALGAVTVVVLALVLRPAERPSARELLAARAEALMLLRTEAVSSEVGLRARAVHALGTVPDPEVTAVLAERLRDPQVQLQAAESLGEHGDRTARAALRPLSASENAELAVAAAESLIRLGDAAAEALLRKRLDDTRPQIKLRAALALCRTGDTEARRLLRTVVEAGALEPAKRPALLLRLAECGDAKARSELAGLLARGGAEEQVSAAAGLLRLGDEGARSFLRELSRRSAKDLLRIAPVLPLLDETVDLNPLRALVAEQAAAPASRELAATGLGASRWAGDVLVLRRLVQATQPSPLRLAAARAVLRIVDNDPSALTAQSLDFAERAIKDGDWQVRASATAVLADLTDAAALGLLSAALDRDEDVRVRRAAVQALGRRRERDALSRLRTGLRDTQPEVREEALRSLLRVAEAAGIRGESGLLRTVTGWLREAQKRGSAREQVLASVALLRLGEAAEAERLRAVLTGDDVLLRRLLFEQPLPDRELMALALSDTDSGVRLAAAQHLAEVNDVRALLVLREAVSRGGLDALRAYGLLHRLDPSVLLPAAAQAALQATDAGARLRAIEALASMPADLAVPLLLQAAFDPDPLVRRLVAEVAAELPAGPGAPSVPPGLPVVRALGADSEPSVRARAQVLLARLNTPTALAAEAAALGRPQPEAPNERATGASSSRSAPPPAVGSTSTAESTQLAAPFPNTPAEPSLAASPAPVPEQPEVDPEAEAAAGQGYVLLSGRPHQYFQIDDGPWRAARGRRIVLTAGPHIVRTLAGELPVTVEPGGTARVRLREAPVEKLVSAGVEAVARKDLRKAQKLLEKAAARCPQGRNGCDKLQSEVSLNLGSVYEGQREYPSALREYQRLLSHSGHASSELRAQAQAGMARIKPLLGRVVVRRLQNGRCVESTLWLPVGEHAVDVGGKSQPVLVQADAEQRVGRCEP